MTKRLIAAVLLATAGIAGWAVPAASADTRVMCVAVEPVTGACVNLPVPRLPARP